MPNGYAARNMPDFERSRVVFSTHGIKHLHHLGDFYNALYSRDPNEIFSIKVDAEISAFVGVGAVMTNANQIRYGNTPPIMLDIKLGDMPSVVASAARALSEVHEPVAFTVNPSSGMGSLRAAVENRGVCQVIVSTVNTSLDDHDCQRIYNRDRLSQVTAFAEMAAEAGAQGIIVGGWEIEALKRLGLSPDLKIYAAGIRPIWFTDPGDNRSTATPAEAIRQGADKIIIGGPVLSQTDPASKRQAAKRILHEVNLTVPKQAVAV